MSFFYASQYGPELVLDSTTKPVINTSFTVTSQLGSKALAVLYNSYDKTLGTAGTGSISTDANGNMKFFADPGYYQVSGTVNGTAVAFNVIVPLFPAEPSLDAIGTMSFYAGPLVSVPGGTLSCDGTAYSRTTYAQLFSLIGTTFGAGNGTTTFNVPDMRSRVPIGSGQGSNLSNYNLGQTGGEETHVLSAAELTVHNHSDSGHLHGVNDPTHGHSRNDPGHSHGVSDPQHNHGGGTGNETATHNHSFPNSNIVNTQASTVGLTSSYNVAATGITGMTTGSENQSHNHAVNNGLTGIATQSNGTGAAINGNGTGVNLQYAGANITNTGSGAGHNNIQPYLSGYWVIKY